MASDKPLLTEEQMADLLKRRQEAPKLDCHAPSYLILDGQQRLTSLDQAFYGVGSHRYFIHLGGLTEGMDLGDRVLYERNRQAKRWLNEQTVKE